MKAVVLVTLILSLCAISFAAESTGIYKDPAHPGKCVVDNQVLSPGEEAKMSEGCGRISCGSHSFATIQTCGVMMVEPPCKLGGYKNIAAPYPDCCEREIICN